MSDHLFLPAGVRAQYNVKVPMRDGVRLSADIYFPREGEGPWPVILTRTPYDNMAPWVQGPAVFWPQHGYVYVAQDCRGRYDSEGEFYPFANEFKDGYDTVEWIGRQPWCDGNVGMSGPSYVGNVQWQAAVGGSRFLKTIIPEVIGDNLYESPNYQGGTFQLGWSATWAFRMAGRTMQQINLYNWGQVFPSLPLRDLPATAGKDIAWFKDWVDHPDYDDYWKALAIKERYEDIKIPVLQIGGWYDFFTAGTLLNYAGMKARGGSPAARRHQAVVMGPWIHRAAIEEITHAGEVDFGKSSYLDLMAIKLRWFDRWLKGIKNGVDAEAPLKLFAMGENAWKNENEWPLARTKFTRWYFHSGGKANSLMGDGMLSPRKPGNEPADQYAYDPAFPTPTRGGCNCCDPEILDWGAFDQRPAEYRQDVLVYTSEPLKEDLEVTGPVIVKLHAASDCRDTDFTGKLVDVAPDGYAVNLCDGIVRARYRESTSAQKPLRPGTAYEFTIDLWPTSNVFKKGHRIRVDIASANFPRFDRNLNTGNPVGTDTSMKVAHQTVFHDAAHPSHILLPVISGS
ncbi:MAG: CocE/NonD family hydrolase [SAR202 cluster bacterium]|nr:CocE/NonD family hydrolase [SAR202 cluster bacterium]